MEFFYRNISIVSYDVWLIKKVTSFSSSLTSYDDVKYTKKRKKMNDLEWAGHEGKAKFWKNPNLELKFTWFNTPDASQTKKHDHS